MSLPTSKRALSAGAVVAAMAGLGVLIGASDNVKILAGRGIKKASAKLYGMLGEDPSSLSACPACECAAATDSERQLAAEEIYALTAAPTVAEEWTALWTEGTSSLSYVWVMQNEFEGIQATVLVDTTGKAQGVVMGANETYVYFVEDSGAVWKVDIDGRNPVELIDYCTADSCSGLGLDSWEYTEKLYFVDSSMGTLMSCNMYTGDDEVTLVTNIEDAYAVAVDKKAGKVYLTASGAIYYTDYSTVGATYSEMSTYFAPSTYDIIGLSVDSEDREVYWTGNDAVYKAAIDFDSPTTLYSDVKDANSVSVDWQQDLLFYTDKYGINIGNLDGTMDSRVAAYLYNTTFVYIKYEVMPTPAPTSIPTSKPTEHPTSVPIPAPTATPTSIPTSEPTGVPAPAPTATPTSIPTSEPTGVPAPVPTSVPTSKPTTTPTGYPTGVPVPLPTSTPTSKPTEMPVPAPTSVPSPEPTSWPTPEPTSEPSSAPTGYPSMAPVPLPTPSPTALPSSLPSSAPTGVPLPLPTTMPSPMPTPLPSALPSSIPTTEPTGMPYPLPTPYPTPSPTGIPTPEPTEEPTSIPTAKPTHMPSPMPTSAPTLTPTTECDWWYGQCGLCECGNGAGINPHD